MINKEYKRRKTHPVKVGGTMIGGDNKIAVQTMTNTPTLDTDSSVNQIRRAVVAGAPIVRLTAQGIAHAKNLANIRQQLNDEGIDVALVADIHFNPAAAFEAAKHVDKVRINPGNFVDPGRTFKFIEYDDASYAAELKRLEDTFVPFLELCRQYDTTIRIGVNHGSLSDRIMSKYGDTPDGMVESAMEFLRVSKRYNFDNIVISIKASNVTVMVETVRKLVKAMDAEQMDYPLHLGVTEAGDGEDGRVKSAVGIGTLLAEGIGDTIRVSLSEDPVEEIPVAKVLLTHIDRIARGEDFVHLANSSRSMNTDKPLPRPYVVGYDVDLPIKGSRCLIAEYPSSMSADQVTIAAAVDLGRILLDDDSVDGIQIISPVISIETANHLALTILQATRRRITRTEYIACPGCGRTMFDLQGTLSAVKNATSHLKGMKIGVMGCIVNGPGEMADADYGYVGGAKDRVSLFRKKECVLKNIPTVDAIPALIKLIKDDGRWIDATPDK